MRKLLNIGFIAIILVLATMSTFAQSSTRNKADTQYKLKAFDLAIDSYLQYLDQNPGDIVAMARLANSYERTNNLLQAARYYEKVISNPKHNPYHVVKYGKILMKLGLYDKAAGVFAKLKDTNEALAQHFINSVNFAKNVLALGDKYLLTQMNISTPNDEFGIEYFTDNKMIYCTFDQNKGNNNNSLIQRAGSKLMVYDKTTKTAKEYDAGIKNFTGIGPVRFSPSGKYVVYTRNNFENGINQIDGNEKDMSLYLAEVDEKGNFINETALDVNAVNYSTAFACFGSNDDEIYYCANKDGKNFDIYKTEKVDGKWTEGKPLPDIINTLGNEITPYFVNGILYFSSDHHNGLGGYDVFKAGVFNGEWAYPVNLGKGINSPSDDIYYIARFNDPVSYVCSNRLGSKGGYDVYEARPLTKEEDEDLIYTYIPEPVQLNNMKDNGTDMSLSPVANVSMKKDDGTSIISLEGAKLISYGEVISNPTKVYFIQLASLTKSRPRKEKFLKLTKFGNIYQVHKGRSTKIRLGYFVSEAEAKAVLASVKRKGFRDAFIVEDVLNTRELELLASSYTFNNNKKYVKPSTTSNYKIKLAAYTNPLYFDVNKVKDLGVIEQWSKGKWTIFILSGYKDINEAKRALIKARNRGFTTAELIMDENGILKKVRNY